MYKQELNALAPRIIERRDASSKPLTSLWLMDTTSSPSSTYQRETGGKRRMLVRFT